MLDTIATYATIIGALFALAGLIIAYIQFWAPWQEQRRLAKTFGAEAFDEQQIRRSLKGYVDPDCSQLDPSGEDDSRFQFSMRAPLIPEMDQILSDRHEGKHVLLLADSGMGKTSFLLHYYARNRKQRQSRRYRIALIPLGRPGVESKIGEIRDKRETILFLDAFDEDTAAIKDRRARLDDLMRLCSDFKRIVVSCRTQFFSSDEEIPRETGVARVGPRRAGEGRIYQFYKLYLAPFSDKQVRRYINSHFPIWQWRRRSRAREVVGAIPELSVRPMLLALVPDLVRQNRIVYGLFELYEFMVESWLEREKDWIEKGDLRQFSETLAVDLYMNRSIRGMERIGRAELAALIHLKASQVDAWKLTSRSLLNRDAEGNYKFAHRSIMEYLFVSAHIKGIAGTLGEKWTDLMRQLFVSWGSDQASKGHYESLSAALNKDYRKTGLFPIFRQPRQPEQLSKTRLLHPTRSAGLLSLYSSLRNVPRQVYSTVIHDGDATVICDLAADCVYWSLIDVPRIIGTPEFVDFRTTFMFTRAEAQRQIEQVNTEARRGRQDWRAPTLDEFDQLFLLHERVPIFETSAYYWSSDKTDTGSWILVSTERDAGSTSDTREVIGTREGVLRKDGSKGYSVFAVPLAGQAGFTARSLEGRAYLILVSHGDAYEFRELTARTIKFKR